MLKVTHLANYLVILACWKPTGVQVALHWHVTFSEPVVLLLNSCDAHGNFAQNLLNLSNGFHLDIMKFLTKFDAVPLDYCSVILWKMKIQQVFSTLSLSHSKSGLPATDAVSPPRLRAHPVLHLFSQKKLAAVTFWTDLVSFSHWKYLLCAVNTLTYQYKSDYFLDYNIYLCTDDSRYSTRSQSMKLKYI